MIRRPSTLALGLGLLGAGTAFGEEPPPVSQDELNDLVTKDAAEAFIFAFDAGDELTEAVFTSARGVGAHVGPGLRFTRYPRADLAGEGEWASHEPPREGGPQAQSCISCHNLPYANGAGPLAMNVAVDPLLSGDPTAYLERNTLHLFGLGAAQRIAEEMTSELQASAAKLQAQACEQGNEVTADLSAKDVSFGTLKAIPQTEGSACTASIDTSLVEGVDDDLIVRIFGWKGTHATIRGFSRGAAHNELGMQAVELVGDGDGDFDGVTDELSTGDMTAMAIYIAALERPTSKLELADHGLVDLEPSERSAIERGESLFGLIGCADCHKPTMTIADPLFQEPSATPGFVEPILPSGIAAEELGLAGVQPVRFDLTNDQPNNIVATAGGTSQKLGSYARDADGQAVVAWYSDFKRHEMGEALADPIDAFGFGASVWPTRSLAGVGSTGPWLHNGHATTLDEAILAHGGEAQESRDAYEALSHDQRTSLVAFLENLIIVDLDPEEDDEEH